MSIRLSRLEYQAADPRRHPPELVDEPSGGYFVRLVPAHQHSPIRAPMDRNRHSRIDHRGRTRRLVRPDVAGAEIRSPARDRYQGDVDPADLGHLVEEVRVAGEVDAAARSPEGEAERFATADERPAAPVVLGRCRLDPDRTLIDRLPRRERQRREPGALHGPDRGLGAEHARRARQVAQRPDVEVIVMGVRDEDDVHLRQRRCRRRRSDPPHVSESRAQHGVGEHPQAVDLDADAGVADVFDAERHHRDRRRSAVADTFSP